MKTIFCGLTLLFSAVFVGISIHLAWWAVDYGYPTYSLDRFLKSSVPIVEMEEYRIQHAGEERIYQDVSLRYSDRSSIQFTVSLPPGKDRPLPAVIILGGLEIGRYSLGYIHRHGENAVIAYQYPYRPTYWYDRPGPGQLEWIRQSALMVPSEIFTILKWIQQQPWYNHQPPAVMGYSFGALFIPAVSHYVRRHGQHHGPLIIAYGGANLHLILQANLKTLPPPVRKVLAPILAFGLSPLEPMRYVHSINTPVLIINGIYDRQIPPESAEILRQMLQNRATIILLPEGHMHPKKTELIDTIVTISRNWLIEQHAINP